mmetsp:Transcript_4570/g.10482  ORF Transcript_4570/g.10482 Transcript_4570/m.10482 type:complete len:240 (-) Transcript_4570:150-869(-)
MKPSVSFLASSARSVRSTAARTSFELASESFLADVTLAFISSSSLCRASCASWLVYSSILSISSLFFAIACCSSLIWSTCERCSISRIMRAFSFHSAIESCCREDTSRMRVRILSPPTSLIMFSSTSMRLSVPSLSDSISFCSPSEVAELSSFLWIFVKASAFSSRSALFCSSVSITRVVSCPTSPRSTIISSWRSRSRLSSSTLRCSNCETCFSRTEMRLSCCLKREEVSSTNSCSAS